MATHDWTADAAEITATVLEYGTTGAIRPESGPDVPVKYVVTQYDERERDGELIQFADRKVVVAAQGISVEPTPSDRIVMGGVSKRIVSVNVIQPADDVLCYILQVRS